MSNNFKVNSKTQILEFKRKHNELVEEIPFEEIEKIKDKLELYVVSASDFASETTVSDNFYSILETGKYYLKVPLSILNPLVENKYAYFYPAVLDETGVLYFTADSDYITTIQVGKNDKVFTVLNSQIGGGGGTNLYRVGVGITSNSILGYFIYSSPNANLTNANEVISDLNTRGFNSANNAYKVSFLVVIDNSSMVSFNFCKDIFISEGTSFYVRNKRSLIIDGTSSSNEVNNNFGSYRISYVEKM